MGRTVPSFRMLLEGIIEELSAFRRALRGDDRAAFDSLMNMATRQHASSCTVAPMLDPMDAVFLSILVEQQKEISSIREALSNDGRTVISNTFKEQLPEEASV
jgi:streptomycin 6-kinase